MLEPLTDLSPTAWLAPGRSEFPLTPLFGPPGMPAYAQVSYLPEGYPGQPEETIEVAEGHPDDREQLRMATDVLRGFTTTPDELFFCLWEGYGGLLPENGMIDGVMHFTPGLLPAQACRAPLLDHQQRRYVCFTGPMAEFGAWGTAADDDFLPPSFIWPADHAWCIAADIDPPWFGVGGSREAIDALLASGLNAIECERNLDGLGEDEDPEDLELT